VRAAFFDLDKTVIAKSSLVALGPELHARGLIRRRTVIGALVRQMIFTRFGANEDRLMKIRESTLRVTKGWDHHEMKQLVAEVITDVIEPLIYDEAIELINQHVAKGDEVWLVSMSPAEIVEPFAELLGINGAICSRAKIDDQGKFTGELEFFAQGENKAIAIRELAHQRGIDLADSFAYSDSETDVPMLKAVGHPYAVNPDRTLARLAAENGWPVLTFSHPVTAGGRARSHTPFFISALVLGALALFGSSRSRRR
jgi:HAD superfamily hydrolase (TIGR01490 family)